MRKNNKVQPANQVQVISQVTSSPEISQKAITTIPDQQGNQKQIDPRLIAGPLAERGCTDILCLLLFIVGIAILAFISQEAYLKGEPERLLAMYDPDGVACGFDKNLDYSYLYFAIPFGDYFNRTVCVKECPLYLDETKKPTELVCKANTLVTSCQQKCDPADALKSFATTNNTGTFKDFLCIFNSSILFDRVCYPDALLSLFQNYKDYGSQFAMDVLTGYIEDLNQTKEAIYCSFAVAFLMGIIYLFFTRLLAGVLVWTSIFLFLVGLGFGTFWCHQQDLYYQDIIKDQTGKYSVEQTSKAKDNQLTFQYLTYVMYGICAFAVIGLICIFNKIRLAIAVIKTAAMCVKDHFLLIFVPQVTAIVLAGLWFWWIYTASYVYAVGEIKGTGNSPFAEVTHTELQIQYLWYFIFGGLWINAFIQAVNNFVIASTCCFWYFAQQGAGGDERAISQSLYRVFRYHAGSLAFGSLILAIVQLIRIMLEYVRYQTEKVAGSENKAVKCLLKCLSCCMACFERFIRFLNNNAYIMIALTGKNFCSAAKAAFETIWANSMRFALVNGIGGAFIFVGKFCISIVTLMIFYYVITTMDYFKEKIFSPVFPCIVVFIIAYALAVLFMSIYGMACDAVLLCFIFDEDLNKQNGGMSASRCPETLKEFLEQPEMANLKQA
ncbi:unnamed protein product [Paramecium sonneborni]|uniref:Choline transporter-like protein n=1 Tax=Paramecium sonneborni TaxID=65129 RepID=A0A8S1Q3U3_9CILI|nr:unnamed protein product [Paramecium sonneborni]